MLTTFPAAWLLLALPFISGIVISQVPPLRGLAEQRYRVTWPIGVAALVILLLELTGLLPNGSALLVMLVAGTISGFSLFWAPRPDGGGNGGDWRREPPQDDPRGGPPPDWDAFDRLRAQWEQRYGGRPRDRDGRRSSQPGPAGDGR